MSEGRLQDRPVACEQGIDGIEVGDGPGGVHEVVQAARGRLDHPELEVEEVDQHQGQPEDGDGGAADDETGTEAVGPAAPFQGGGDAQGQRHDHGNEEAVEGQLHRGRDPVLEVGGHGVAAGIALAEVALRQVDQVGAELDVEGLVQPHLLLQLPDGPLVGELAGAHQGRIAGQDVGEQEDRGDHAQDGDRRQEQAAGDVTAPVGHRGFTCLAQSRQRRGGGGPGALPRWALGGGGGGGGPPPPAPLLDGYFLDIIQKRR